MEAIFLTYSVRYVKYVCNPYSANCIPVISCNADGVTLLLQGNIGGVVYFYDGMICAGVDIGEPR